MKRIPTRDLAVALLSLAIGAALPSSAAATIACPLKIGFVRPESGSGASFGHSLEKGMTMGLDKVNAAGGILGCPIKIIAYDSQSIPSNAAVLARRLLFQDGVPLIIGSSPSPEVLAMMEVTENAGVPLYVPSASSSKITDQGFKWVWRQSVIDVSAAKLLSEIMTKDLGWKRVGAIYENTDYGKPVVRDVLGPSLETHGAKLVAQEAFNPGDTDLSGQLLRIRDVGADGLVYWGHEKEGAILAKANHELKVDLPMAGNTGLVYPGFLDLLSPEVQAATRLIAVNPFVWTDGTPEQREWVKTFKGRWGIDPDITSMDGYDAVFFLKSALNTAGSLEPAAIAKALSGTVYDGVGGQIAYDKTGQAARPLTVVKLTPKSGPGFEVLKVVPAGEF